MLMDHIPRCPCSWYVIQLHGRIIHVLEEFMLEAGATKGRDLWLVVRRIRSGASRYRPWDVDWLDFMAPRRHLVVGVTVTSARTNTNVPRDWKLEIVHNMCRQIGPTAVSWATLLCHSRLISKLGPGLFDHVHLSTHLHAMCVDVPRELKNCKQPQ
jgi:hypothetical protein